MSVRHQRILALLKEQEGAVDVVFVAQALGLSLNYTSVLMKKLGDLGLVKTIKKPNAMGRVKHVFLLNDEEAFWEERIAVFQKYGTIPIVY